MDGDAEISITQGDGEHHSTAIEKSFHIFVSYRVRTDATLAERLTDKLQIQPIKGEEREILLKCFLDQQSLRQGEDYMTQFLDALKSSCLFLPIISESNIASMYHLTEGASDNVLMEWETALNLFDNGHIDIIPLLIGSLTTEEGGTQVYKRFSAFNLNLLPEVHTAHGGGKITVRETVGKLLRLQGLFVNPSDLAEKLAALVDKFSKDVWPKHRSSWHNQKLLGPEPFSACVQCGEDYKESENVDGSCRFHAQWNGGGDMLYPCCRDNDAGCKRGIHRKLHHNDYPYSAHGEWSNAITSYMSESFLYISADDHNLTISGTANIEVGMVTETHPTDAGKVFISGWANNIRKGRWFMTFSSADFAGVDTEKPIFHLANEEGTMAWANWVPESSEPMLMGIEVSCTTRTCTTPATSRIFIRWPKPDQPALPKVTSIVEISKPTFGERPSTEPHTLPGPYVKGPLLTVPRKRNPQEPNAWSTSRLRMQLKFTNQAHTNRNWDFFIATVVVVNPTDKPVGLLSARSWWKLAPSEEERAEVVKKNAGKGEDWAEADETDARESNGDNNSVKKLPLQVPAFGTITLMLQSMVKDCPDGDKFSDNRIAWMVRLCPIVVDFEVEDLDGNKCGVVAEFLWSGELISQSWAKWDESQRPDELLVMICDNVPSWERERALVREGKSNYNDEEELYGVSFGNRWLSITTQKLRRAVLQAERLRDGKPKLLAEDGSEEEGIPSDGPDDGSTPSAINATEDIQYRSEHFKGELWYLMDLPARRVYALKLAMHSSTTSSVAFFPIGLYGDAAPQKQRKEEKSKYEKLIKRLVVPIPQAIPPNNSPEASIGAIQNQGFVPYDTFEPIAEFSPDPAGRQKQGWALPFRYKEQAKVKLEPRIVREALGPLDSTSAGATPEIDRALLEETVRKIVKEEFERAVEQLKEDAASAKESNSAQFRNLESLVTRLGQKLLGDKW